MRGLISLALMVIISMPLYSQTPPDTEWTRTYGGGSPDYGFSVQQTSDGGYIIGGRTGSFGAVGYDIYLVKANAGGHVEWQTTFGDDYDNFGYYALEDYDKGYIITGYTWGTGAGQCDVIFIKTDSLGNLVWSATYGGVAEDGAYYMINTPDSCYVAIGFSASYSGTGLYDVYVLKITPNGDTLWTGVYGGANNEEGKAICLSGDGGYVLTGYTNSFWGGWNVYVAKIDSNGNLIWEKWYGGADTDGGWGICRSHDGGYMVVGYTYSFGAGNFDIWVLKLDANGDTVWTRTYGGADEDRGYAIVPTDDGGYLISGMTRSYGAGYVDVYILKIDSAGNVLWTKTVGGSAGTEEGFSACKTNDGGYAILGYTTSFGQGGGDAYLIKLKGTLMEQENYFGTGNKIKILTDLNSSLFFNRYISVILDEKSVNDYRVSLYTSTGRRVYVKYKNSGNLLRITDVSSLPEGIYFLSVSDNRRNIVKSRVIKK